MSRSRNVANRTQTGSPHIITTKLHPAYLGKLIDGTTSHSGAYGTEQSDGRMYYYTDIAGSKPIHDPRIGAHFGSQRHYIRSMQLLEQETATNGTNVYSLDGRNWLRLNNISGTSTVFYDSNGNSLELNASGDYVEVVGYFNAMNILWLSFTSGDDFNWSLNGTSAGSVSSGVNVNTPLNGRFVNGNSVYNLSFSSTPTLGINTVKITGASGDFTLGGVELIVQDTTDTASKSKIQIPKQSVYTGNGKHEVPAQAVHYDPFNGMTTASGFGGYVDEKSSLGLDKWKVGATCYRPYNGGRVVKWIDIDGVIKTSVTCMPPNAKSVANSSSLTNGVAKSDASASNDTFYPTFESHTTSVNEDDLHEVAKSFYFREFGNGAANTGGGGNWADASMIGGSSDDVAYVMDDGLTSFSGDDQYGSTDKVYSDSRTWHMTFIGTGLNLKHNDLNGRSANFLVDGISIHSGTYSSNPDYNKVQNLPYGTHVVKYEGTSTYHAFSEATFYQPKRPPIPEDACVLADYMLMADFVIQATPSSASAGMVEISKGVRVQHNSRDFFADDVSGFHNSQVNHDHQVAPSGFYLASNSTTSANASSNKMSIPAFGTTFVANGHSAGTRNDIHIDGSDVAQTDLTTSGGASHADLIYPNNAVDLGLHTFEIRGVNSTAYSPYLSGKGFQVVTPIHTSHHYQAFETPYLHELVGGDRNVEQTNLICSSDGKSWDEITRDTSYMGKNVVSVSHSLDSWFGDNTHLVFDRQRGGNDSLGSARYIKDSFTLAYDGYICLKDGQYKIIVRYLSRASNSTIIKLNGTRTAGAHHDHSNYSSNTHMDILQLVRGDLIQIYDEIHGGVWSHFYIEKI